MWVSRGISTRKILQAERELVRTVNAGVDAVQLMAQRFEAPFWLSQDRLRWRGLRRLDQVLC